MAARSGSDRGRAYRTTFRKRYGITYGEARILSRQLFGSAGSPARAARLTASSQRGVDLGEGRSRVAGIANRAIVFRGTVANALADVRSDIHDLAGAEAAYGFASGTIRAQFPTAFGTDRHVGESDGEPVIMEILSREHGSAFVVTRSSHERSIVAQQGYAIQHYRRTGDTSRLDELEGVQVGGLTLETDAAVIEALDEAGGLPQGPYPQARGTSS